MGPRDVRKLHPTCHWLILTRFLLTFHLSCSSCLPLRANFPEEQERGGIMIPLAPNLTKKQKSAKITVKEWKCTVHAKLAANENPLQGSLPISVPSGRWSISSTSFRHIARERHSRLWSSFESEYEACGHLSKSCGQSAARCHPYPKCNACNEPGVEVSNRQDVVSLVSDVCWSKRRLTFFPLR